MQTTRLIRSTVATASIILALGACTILPVPGAVPDDEDEAVTDIGSEPRWIGQRVELIEVLFAEHGIQAHGMDDGGLLLRLPAAEGFALNSAALTSSLTAMLDRVVQVFNAHPDTALKVLGHTDSIGSELYNLRLSIERAEAVMDYLRTQGIALGRLSADGRGEAEPIADNATEAGRIVNRRVEIIIRPLE